MAPTPSMAAAHDRADADADAGDPSSSLRLRRAPAGADAGEPSGGRRENGLVGETHPPPNPQQQQQQHEMLWCRASAPAHRRVKESPLSSDAIFRQSHAGLLNLCIVVLIAVNSRLIIENLMKYGLLIRAGFWFSARSLGDWPLLMCCLTLPIFPLAAFMAEKLAQRKLIREHVVILLHIIITTSVIVYPVVVILKCESAVLSGFVLMFLSSITWLKLVSFAHTNYDIRVLSKSIEKETCEMAVKYNDLEQEKTRLQQAYEQLEKKNKRLEEEKTALGESAKKALEAKDAEYSRTLKEAREKHEEAQRQLNKYQGLLTDNQKYREENERLHREKNQALSQNEDLQKKCAQLTEINEKQRSEHDADLKKIKEGLDETEAYLCDHLRKTTQSLAVFCSEPKAESQRVSERLGSYGPDFLDTPWASAKIAEDMIRLEDRAQSAKNQAEMVVEATQRIDASLWPEETFGPSVQATIDQLEKVPDRIDEWKLSAARAGVGFALALVKTHFPKAKDLERVGTGNPPGKDCISLLPDYAATASRVAAFIDLDSFVEDTQDIEEDE